MNVSFLHEYDIMIENHRVDSIHYLVRLKPKQIISECKRIAKEESMRSWRNVNLVRCI